MVYTCEMPPPRLIDQLSQTRSNGEVLAILDTLHPTLVQGKDNDLLAEVLLAVSKGTSQIGRALAANMEGIATLARAPAAFNKQAMEHVANHVNQHLDDIERCAFQCLLGLEGASDMDQTQARDLVLHALGTIGQYKAQDKPDAFWAGYFLTVRAYGPQPYEALDREGAGRLSEYLNGLDNRHGTIKEAGYAIRLSQMITSDDYSALLTALAMNNEEKSQQLVRATMEWADPLTIGQELLTRAAFRPGADMRSLLQQATPQALDALPALFQAMPDWMGKDPEKPDEPGVCCLGMQINAAACLDETLAELRIDLLAGADPALGERMAHKATTQAEGTTQDIWRRWAATYRRKRLDGVAQEARPEGQSSRNRNRL